MLFEDLAKMFVLPMHVDDLINGYTGEPDDVLETLDQSAAIATLKTDVETLTDAAATTLAGVITSILTNIDGFVDSTTLSGPDKTSLKASIHGEINANIVPATIFGLLYSDIEGKIDDDITAEVDVNITDVLAGVKTALIAAITAGRDDFPARTVIDGKCVGNGFYSKADDTLDSGDADIRRICNSCGGYGKTEETNVPQRQWTLQEEIKTEA